MQELPKMLVWSLDQEDPVEEEMATHSSILAWEITWREKPSGLQSMGSPRNWHYLVTECEWSMNVNIHHTCVLSHFSHVTLCDPNELQPARLLCPWDSPGKSTGVGCHALLHGIFPTQGSNLSLLHCRWILYCLSHQGRPFMTCQKQMRNEKWKCYCRVSFSCIQK